MGDPVFELSADGVHVGYLGPRERSPIPPELILGRSVHEVWPPEVAEMTARAVRDVCAQRVPVSFECSLPSPLEPRYYEVRVVPGVQGHAFAIVRDIHARRTAENQLRESEARFRLMADHAPVMLWKANRRRDCDFFNRGWLEFTGRPLEPSSACAGPRACTPRTSSLAPRLISRPSSRARASAWSTACVAPTAPIAGSSTRPRRASTPTAASRVTSARAST